jgi:hypothetical protein
MKTHGDQEWETLPSYFDTLIPIVLDLLDRIDLKITFFIVGQDAALKKNWNALNLITERGHEVGNHSFHHEVWLHSYPKETIRQELQRAEENIVHATGQKPVGFRGPGFVWSPALLEVLAENHYLYDATILPTYIGPLARMYYFWRSDLSSEERDKRKKIYSSFREGLRPVKPYCWLLNGDLKLLEIPVTTIPILKTPFHLSYLIYLSGFSSLLMRFYLNLAMLLCRLTNTAPSFLLHPLDFIGGREISDLSFFPGMNIDAKRKSELFSTIMKMIRRYFEFVNMSTFARKIMESSEMRIQKL